MDDIVRYLNVRRAYAPSFAPDGQRLAFLTDITGVPQVWQVALPRPLEGPRWPDQLTFGRERVGGVHFSPTDDLLIFTRDVGGDERMQLFSLGGDGEERCLTEGYAQVRHAFGAWARDGGAFLFAANRRDPRLFDLYRQTLEGEAELVWRNEVPGYLASPVFAPDGRRAAVVRQESSFNHRLFEVDLTTGEARPLFRGRGEAAGAAWEGWTRFRAVAYAPEGDALFVLTDYEADFLYLARLELATGSLRPLVRPAWDCEGFALSPDGRRLVYVVNEDGASRLYVLTLATGRSRPAPPVGRVPGVVMGALTFSPDGRKVAFTFTSSVRTNDVYVWDLEADVVTAVTRSAHGGVPVASFVAPVLVRYPTFDREATGEVRRIPAWFYLPPEASAAHPVPAVVIVHGGPEGQYRPTFRFFAQYLVHHGYAVLAPNVRGSTGYGKVYSHLDDVERRMDAVADLAYAAHWLREQPEVAGDRLAVYGGSYGGFMVLAALTTYPDLWAAGVDVVGVSNLATFLEHTSPYRRAHREAEYGSLERDRDFLERIAPIHHVDRIRAPLMVIHGANDPRVPLGEAEQLVAALRRRHVPVEFLVFDDEGHGLVKLKNKLVAYPAIVAFLERYLKG